jgi:Tfp pilus assembly protein PilF
VVGLIGLTAVVKKGANEPATQLAQAQELLKQAQQAVEANKTDQAKALLKQAITASPNLMEAYQALADLCEKGGKEDETLEAYRQWTQAGARTPMPWNRLGQILERRKDYKDALKAYTQSLKIEWNQPPAIEAKSRLEKLIGQ